MYEGLPEFFDYVIRLAKLKPERDSLDIVTFHLLGILVAAANHALVHYFTLTLGEGVLPVGNPVPEVGQIHQREFRAVVKALRALEPVADTLYHAAATPLMYEKGQTCNMKSASIWLGRVRKEYDCCVIKQSRQITLSAINFSDWIDPESWFRDVYLGPPVITRKDIDIVDRAVLNRLQSEGMVRVEQMRSSLEEFAGWLRENCTMEYVTKLQ